MIIDGSLASTVGRLSAIPDAGQRLRAFTGAIVEEGGTILLPPDDSHWGPLLVEFSFKGILGTGMTPEEAMTDWLICASRVVQSACSIGTPLAPAPAAAPRLHA